MKVIMFLIAISLVGCNAFDELNSIISKQEGCKRFKAKFESSKIPEDAHEKIKIKIAECKKLNAWK